MKAESALLNSAWLTSRRQLLRVGALTTGGLSLPALLQARAAGEQPDAGKMFGRAKNVIFLYLAGGPPQHETFDPKPEAPLEIRGPFQPISTNVPGIQFCELLPRTAQRADKLAVVRSMATDDNLHDASGAWVLTGYQYRGANARVISPTDWPHLGSIVKMLKPSTQLPALSSVWLPDLWRLNENVTPAGQTGGFLGSQWDPERFVGDPSLPDYEIESLRKTDVTADRLRQRRELLSRLELPSPAGVYDIYRQQAFDLLTSGQAREAFAIHQEPAEVRDRYGRNRWGQCVLLARRLVEAGVRLVHVQWPREDGDNAVDNPLWDTHAQNADRLEDVLCPMFDVGFSALIDDLHDRGLLEETLVVAIGEFGRTPKINGHGGRDHWGPVFSFVMAGAGISGGQVFGSSDRTGAYPASNRVHPGDLSATIFHLLGIDPHGMFPDRQGRPHRITEGTPMYSLLGTEPATSERTVSTGHVARVAPFDPSRLLAQTGFAGDSLKPLTASSRPKGWRADPLLSAEARGFGVRILPPVCAALGIHDPEQSPLEIPAGARILLGQEVRSPFAGTYQLSVKLSGRGSSPEFFQHVFLQHFSFRLQFVQFTTLQKQFTDTRELAGLEFVPKFAVGDAPWQTVELTRQFINPTPGANFSFGAGLGVTLLIQKKTPGPLSIESGTALLFIPEMQLAFQGKPVNDKVQV